MQMIIRRIQPLLNAYLDKLPCCKSSAGGSGHLQMIIWRYRTLANDLPEDPASCKVSSGGSGHLQLIIWRTRPLANNHPSPPSPLQGSRFNLPDLSKTIYSSSFYWKFLFENSYTSQSLTVVEASAPSISMALADVRL